MHAETREACLFLLRVQCVRELMDHKGVYFQALPEGIVATKHFSVILSNLFGPVKFVD